MSIKIALAGNPNCGKTTLFNNLTGSNQYVGPDNHQYNHREQQAERRYAIQYVSFLLHKPYPLLLYIR